MMARAPGESRIPVLRSGIPLAFAGSRGRSGIPLTQVRAARPTDLSGLTAHWPATSSSQEPSPASSSSSPTTTTSSSDPIGLRVDGTHLGCEVIVGGTKPGVLRYFGTLPFDSGLWCGVELYKPEGLNDGSVKGTRLFRCRPMHGVVAPREKVALLASPPTLPQAPPSPPHLPAPPAHLSSPQLLPALPQVPSGVKRQRTDTYESTSEAAADEDGGSTPRQTTAPSGGEEDKSSSEGEEDRWSAEDESTPPAEDRKNNQSPGSPGVHKRVVSLLEPLQSSFLSPSSQPSPIPLKALDWSQPTISSGDSEGSHALQGFIKVQRYLRSSSDGSLCEIASIPKTCTPTCVNSVAGTPLSSTTRCSTRSSNQGNKRCVDETGCYGLGISKQSSFELDESLGILTPDQMDSTLCMHNCVRTPSSEELKRLVLEGESVAIGMSSFPEGLFSEDDINMLSDVTEGNSEAVEAPLKENGILEGRGAEGRLEGDEEGTVEVEEGRKAGESVREESKVRSAMEEAVDEHPSSALATSAQPPPRPTQVSSTCFVASVTSITSIDPGYQGDGEWSRPASRADNSPGSSVPPGIGANAGLSVDVLKVKFDAMTDSDFYSDTGACGTESDAEEAAREGAMAGGDRRAQVIDGTLYGGSGGQHTGGMVHSSSSHHHQQQPQPRCFAAAVMTSSTATTTEEMESSGVFSDLDRKGDTSSQGGPPWSCSLGCGGGDSSSAADGCFPAQNSHGMSARPSSAQGITSSAAESSDVPQSPLEELPEDPKKDIVDAIGELTYAAETTGDLELTVLESNLGRPPSLEGTLVDSSQLESPEKEAPKAESQEATRARNGDASSRDDTPIPTPTSSTPAFPRPSSSASTKKESPAAAERPPRGSPRKKAGQQGAQPAPSKKYKMPKRNVASKIKAMIEAPKEEVNREEVEARRQIRAQGQKKGRWDAIMSKIAAGQAEQRTSRPRLREVKSRVLANISNAQPTGDGREDSETRVRAKKTFASNANRTRRAETRRSRARGLDMSSLRDATCAGGVAGPSGVAMDNASLIHSPHSSLSDVSVSQGAISKASSSRSSKKRGDACRSTSPFSDGSSNSGASNIPRPMPSTYHHNHQATTTPSASVSNKHQMSHSRKERSRETSAVAISSDALTMASSTSSAALVRRSNLRNNHLTSSSSAAKRVVAVHRKPQTEKAAPSEMKIPQTRKPISRHLAPSSAQLQKPGSIRDGGRLGGALVNKNGTSNRGTTVVVVQRQQQVLLQQSHVQPPMELPTAAAAPENVAEALVPQKGPQEGPVIIPTKLLQELKHSCAGVEALGVLLQYLVFDLDAYSTPRLKKMVDSFKAESINYKLNIDEAVARCRQLEEAAELSKQRHKEELMELINKHQEAMAELEVRLNTQVEETQSRYEEELKRRERLTARDTEALLDHVKVNSERAEKAEMEREELRVREGELKTLNNQLEKEIAEMQERFRLELAEVSRTGESGKLRDEIGSLQAVLDLRTKEMHEYRKKAEEWWHKSEALNSAVARAAALQARVEDLEAQLQRKSTSERKLNEKVRSLSESMERECRQNEQLAQENEVLEWKVNESTKLMASLSASMTGSMMASSSPSSDQRSNVSAMAHSLGSPDSPPAFMFPRFSPRLSSKSPFSDVSGTLELDEEDEEDLGDEGAEEEAEEEEEEDEDDVEIIEDNSENAEANEMSPKVRTLVEKNESISWLVEMEEVIPAGLTSHISSSALASRCCASDNASPFAIPSSINHLLSSRDTLPPNSDSTSPTSSDPSNGMFYVEGMLLAHCGSSNGKGPMPPSKKTRLERGKCGYYSSTPLSALPVNNYHRHHHLSRYQHQSRASSRIPPSSSPLGSGRSRSVSSDSESFERDRLSPMSATGSKPESKVWYRGGGKSCKAWVERVPMLNVTSSVVEGVGSGKWVLEGGDRREEASEQPAGAEGVAAGEGSSEGYTFEEGEASSSEDDVRVVAVIPRRTDAQISSTKDKSPSKRTSPYYDLSEDLSDQSPYHSKGDSNDGYVLTDDNSSSTEFAIGVPHKKQPPSCPSPAAPPPSAKPSSCQTTFHHSSNQGVLSAVDNSIVMHHRPHHAQHVLSSLCAHPHLSIKESAGEAMISEEISDDTQGESEEEDQRTKDEFPDNENKQNVEL